MVIIIFQRELLPIKVLRYLKTKYSLGHQLGNRSRQGNDRNQKNKAMFHLECSNVQQFPSLNHIEQE